MDVVFSCERWDSWTIPLRPTMLIELSVTPDMDWINQDKKKLWNVNTCSHADLNETGITYQKNRNHISKNRFIFQNAWRRTFYEFCPRKRGEIKILKTWNQDKTLNILILTQIKQLCCETAVCERNLVCSGFITSGVGSTDVL